MSRMPHSSLSRKAFCPGRKSGLLRNGNLKSGGQPGDPRHILRARALAALLPAALKQRRGRKGRVADDRRAHALRAAKLMRRKEQHIRSLKLAKRQAANGLHRVADQYRAFRMHDFCNFRSRLDDTRLVIRSLHGGGRTGRKRSLKRIQIDGTIFQHRNCLELAGLEAMAGKDAWMLDGANRQRLTPSRLQKPIRRLGPAAREIDLRCINLENRGDGFARVLDNLARGAALGVDRRRIADAIERRNHRGARLRAQRRGGIMVEIGAGLHCAASAPTASLHSDSSSCGTE